MYLDNAATTMIYASAVDAMQEVYDDYWANPSSLHSAGKQAKTRVESARAFIADMVMENPDASRIFFTSGGTEGNNWAIESAARWGLKKGRKIILVSGIEHHSVLRKIESLKERGFVVMKLSPQKNGVMDVDLIKNTLRKLHNVCLVSVMHVNNEVGTIQPIEEIGKLCKQHGVLFHVDGVQGMPHIIPKLDIMGVSYYTTSAHKFGGPRGVGFMYVQKKAPLYPLLYGGEQEHGLRAGTENVAGIAGMDIALGLTCKQIENPPVMSKSYMTAAQAKEELIELVKEYGGTINGDVQHSVPTIVNFTIPFVNGESLVAMLNQKGIYVSAGSACTSGDPSPSHVLMAMGLGKNIASNSVRVSFTEVLSWIEFQKAKEIFRECIEFLKK